MADEPFDSAWAILKQGPDSEEQMRAQIEAANAEARKRLQAQQAPPQRPYGPISPEDLRRLQLQALRRMKGPQDPKISNYMADSAESMVRNNPIANLAHPSGQLPGVPLPDTEPLDLSMESLRSGGAKGMPPMEGQTANLYGQPVMSPPIQAHLQQAMNEGQFNPTIPNPPVATLPGQVRPTERPYSLLQPMVGVLAQTRQNERLPQTVDDSTMYDE